MGGKAVGSLFGLLREQGLVKRSVQLAMTSLELDGTLSLLFPLALAGELDLRFLTLPSPLPANTLRLLRKLEEFLGPMDLHQRKATQEASQPASPAGGATCPPPIVLGADCSLGSCQDLLLSLPDSAFIVNMERFPSFCPKAFSL